MSESKIYLTVAKEKRQPQNDCYIAAVTQGSLQHGDRTMAVLTTTKVQNQDEAKEWFKRMIVERPWETRN